MCGRSRRGAGAAGAACLAQLSNRTNYPPRSFRAPQRPPGAIRCVTACGGRSRGRRLDAESAIKFRVEVVHEMTPRSHLGSSHKAIGRYPEGEPRRRTGIALEEGQLGRIHPSQALGSKNRGRDGWRVIPDRPRGVDSFGHLAYLPGTIGSVPCVLGEPDDDPFETAVGLQIQPVRCLNLVVCLHCLQGGLERLLNPIRAKPAHPLVRCHEQRVAISRGQLG